jgi:hypothetical protein
MHLPHSSTYPDHLPLQDESQDQPADGFPWETRSSWLDLTAFWKSSLNILLSPSAAFGALNYRAGLRSSLVFALVYGSLGQIIGQYWITVAEIHFGTAETGPLENTLLFGETALLTPIVLLLGIFFSSCLVHVFLLIFGAAQRPFSTTFQVLAYVSGATSLLNLIPFLGSLIMPFWGLVLCCVGLATAHQTTKTRAFFALFFPPLLAGLLIAGLFLALAAFGALEFLQVIQRSL